MKKRIAAFAVLAVLALSTFFGCAQTAPESSSAAPSESQEASQTAEESEAATQEPEESVSASADASEPAEVPEDTASADSGERRTITDMAGRSVEIPNVINKVYGTTPVASIYMYTLAPEKLLGWNYELNDWEKKYIQAEYQDLPVYGMSDNLNLEALIEAAPDVILQIGGLGDKAKVQADELTSQTGIPVLMYSLDLDLTANVYEELGVLLQEEDRAAELADYAGRTIATAQEKTSQIPEDQRVTVYYGNGPESLNTAPEGSDATEVIEMAGGVNCAAVELPSDTNETERVDISPEQLISWNPDVIFVNGEPKDSLSAQAAADAILNSETYASLKAVADGKVYGIPQTPFSWLDRPKAPNRLIGLVWAGALMYPDQYQDVDITEETQNFYKLFYHVDLTPEDVAQLPSE